MVLIEYMKALGLFLALILAISKWQPTPIWMTIGSFSIGYTDLVLGYFIGTLSCSLIFLPNMTTYAIWFYYGISIVIISISQMLRLGSYSHFLAGIINALIASESIIILHYDDLLWKWEWGHIASGIISSIIITGFLVFLKKYIKRIRVIQFICCGFARRNK